MALRGLSVSLNGDFHLSLDTPTVARCLSVDSQGRWSSRVHGAILAPPMKFNEGREEVDEPLDVGYARTGRLVDSIHRWAYR